MTCYLMQEPEDGFLLKAADLEKNIKPVRDRSAAPQPIRPNSISRNGVVWWPHAVVLAWRLCRLQNTRMLIICNPSNPTGAVNGTPQCRAGIHPTCHHMSHAQVRPRLFLKISTCRLGGY